MTIMLSRLTNLRPPGSGKTKTIIAMVGAILTQSLQQQKEEQLHKLQPQVQRPGSSKPAPAPPKKKLLICAPSNAAVDELVLRLKEGIQPLNGPRQKINVIRIGRSDAINASVKDVMLDELVRVKLEGTSGEKDKIIQDRDNLHQEAGKVKERLNIVRPAMEAGNYSHPINFGELISDLLFLSIIRSRSSRLSSHLPFLF
jgi:senataxin